ncbi:hypothetical protein DCS_04989 [Drechmeria coniospora]|uniref:Uncharacterized protein n=1 Tax=Drechmeria coniospora TaxID=98403 RepID=A0A151GLK8_DRECN|nr:hypothetical protein DCS_04989 [Drechmeria coniospora]KYK57976.1 hypothetical protein DCS_04989 [Drechmeria coniospora]
MKFINAIVLATVACASGGSALVPSTGKSIDNSTTLPDGDSSPIFNAIEEILNSTALASTKLDATTNATYEVIEDIVDEFTYHVDKSSSLKIQQSANLTDSHIPKLLQLLNHVDGASYSLLLALYNKRDSINENGDCDCVNTWIRYFRESYKIMDKSIVSKTPEKHRNRVGRQFWRMYARMTRFSLGFSPMWATGCTNVEAPLISTDP